MIKPLYLSNEIFELVFLGSEISLHSVFNSSINFRLNDIIVNVSSNEYILPPYGIVVKDKDFRDLKYELENKKLNLNINIRKISINNIEIDLANSAKKYNSKIRRNHNKILNSNMQNLVNKLLSLGNTNGFNIGNSMMIDTILNADSYLPDHVDDINVLKFASKLKLLIDFFLDGDNYEGLKYFIGRGMGLTPSGDDFLVGIMAIFFIYDVFKESMLKIREFILKNKGVYTNDISEQFLILSTENKFSINLIVLLDGLISLDGLDDKAVNNVLSYGGTSGVDTILGILFAYQIMNRSGANE